jgi:hypothetical protein
VVYHPILQPEGLIEFCGNRSTHRWRRGTLRKAVAQSAPTTVTIENVQQTLVACATSLAAPLLERVAAGEALNDVGDPVLAFFSGCGQTAGLPDIARCDVAAGAVYHGQHKAS